VCSGSEAGSYVRRIDSRITQLTAQGPSRTCNESKEEPGEGFGLEEAGADEREAHEPAAQSVARRREAPARERRERQKVTSLSTVVTGVGVEASPRCTPPRGTCRSNQID